MKDVLLYLGVASLLFALLSGVGPLLFVGGVFVACFFIMALQENGK